MLKAHRLLFGILVLFYWADHARGDLFDLLISDDGGLTSSQFATFGAAEATIEAMILSTDNVGFGEIQISARGLAIDGVGNTLGSAGPTLTGAGVQTGHTLATRGIMLFDTADLAALENNGTLADVILHEMLHVIGFGTLWDANGLLTPSLALTTLGEYKGAAALAAYNAEFGLSESFVPVENNGEEGTANAHWDEEFFGVQRNGNTAVDGVLRFGPNSNELMTGYLGGSTAISNTTRSAFTDLGYNVVSVPEPTQIALCSLGIFILSQRRRRSH